MMILNNSSCVVPANALYLIRIPASPQDGNLSSSVLKHFMMTS